jgi:hypothetical protein
MFAQTSTITGKVTSKEDGQAVPGASVVVKGTSIGTVTAVSYTHLTLPTTPYV